MMESSVSICPVPEEQQPINEYQELQESWFFRWVTLDLSSYISKLLFVWGLSWFVSAPVAAVSFAPKKYLLHFILAASAGAGVFLVLTLLRLYLGWSYIRSRLLQETIFYEESGWYDGQTWTKTPEIFARDRLIVSYQIQPILQRLQRTFAILVLFVVGGGLIWNFL
ncbi:MAG: CGLD27 family protein [Symploca sp. SIO2E6]|nr:CGLD27 family protein [Symploca sp. SIO2E6]